MRQVVESFQDFLKMMGNLQEVDFDTIFSTDVDLINTVAMKINNSQRFTEKELVFVKEVKGLINMKTESDNKQHLTKKEENIIFLEKMMLIAGDKYLTNTVEQYLALAGFAAMLEEIMESDNQLSVILESAMSHENHEQYEQAHKETLEQIKNVEEQTVKEEKIEHEAIRENSEKSRDVLDIKGILLKAEQGDMREANLVLNKFVSHEGFDIDGLTLYLFKEAEKSEEKIKFVDIANLKGLMIYLLEERAMFS